MVKSSIPKRINRWREKNLKESYFIILLSIIIGLTAGLASYVLKTAVFYIQELITASFHIESQNYLYVVYPAIGIALTVLFVRFIVRDHVKHGIPRILYVISRLDGKMRPHKSFSSLVGGSLTAGFGGSVGLESPIISTGASIGSNIGQYLKLNYRTTTLLIGCGAAGAMASIFTTPIAAVVFSLEVLMLDLTTSSIIPLLIASVTGAITTKLLLAEDILVHFKVTEDFVISDIPFFIILGILCGLISLYFSKMFDFMRHKFTPVKSGYARVLIGGLMLGILIFLFPSLYGEGYDAIRMIISGNSENLLNNSFFYVFRDNAWLFVSVVMVIMLLKVVATTLTIEGGGIGGIFAPAAVMGGLSGFAFARLINDLHITGPLHESNFTLVGMAGVLSGVLHAPLTAIFLIAEMTNGYELIVPLMLVSAISFLTIKTFDPHSIFTRQLVEHGAIISHHKDKTVLTLLNVKKVIETDLKTIHKTATLGDLVKVIAKSRRNIFPVVDSRNRFKGLIILDSVRNDMFRKDKYDIPVTEYMFQPKEDEIVSTSESMEKVMEKFNRTGNYNLLVVDNEKYIGLISRANVFSAYRKTLIDVSQE